MIAATFDWTAFGMALAATLFGFMQAWQAYKQKKIDKAVTETKADVAQTKGAVEVIKVDVAETKEVVANTDKTVEIIHTLTNSSMGEVLSTGMVSAKALSISTPTAENIELFKVAEKKWKEHEAKQAKVDAKI